MHSVYTERMTTTEQATATFVAVQIETGQWRVQNTNTGRMHGIAFRYEGEAEARAQHLARIYA